MRTPGLSSSKWTNQKTWLVSDPARSSPPEPKPGALKREEGFEMWQWKDRRLVFSVGLGLTVLVQRAHKHTHVHSKRNSPPRNSHMTEKGVSVCVWVCSGGHLKERVQLMIKYVLDVCVVEVSVWDWVFSFFLLLPLGQSGFVSSSTSTWSDMWELKICSE